MKRKIRLTESQLTSLIKKTIYKIINEVSEEDYNKESMGEQEDVPSTHDSSDVIHKPGEKIVSSPEKKPTQVKNQTTVNKVAPKYPHPSEPHDVEKIKKSVPRYNPKPVGSI